MGVDCEVLWGNSGFRVPIGLSKGTYEEMDLSSTTMCRLYSVFKA